MSDYSPFPLYFLATGGFTHMLRHLANAIKFADHRDRETVYVASAYPTVEVSLDQLLSWEDLNLRSEDSRRLGQVEIPPPFPGWPGRIGDYQVEWHAPDNYVLLNVPAETASFVQLDHWRAAQASKPILTTGSWTCPNEGEVNFHLIQAFDYLLPRMHVGESAHNWIRTILEKLPTTFVGVHYRNSDLRTDYHQLRKALVDSLERLGTSDVYWATDDPLSLGRIERDVPQANFITTSHLPDGVGTEFRALHLASDAQLRRGGTGFSKLQQQIEGLGDVFALTRGTNFLGNPDSGLTQLVYYLRTQSEVSHSFFGI